MTKIRLIILTIFSVIIVVSNIYSGFINVFTEGLFKSYLFQTENAEFEFWTMPSKGRDVAMMERQFSDFKMKNPKYVELQIFRTFKRNPLKFWNWYGYLKEDLYKYDYQEKVDSSLKEPIRIEQIESAYIEIGPNYQLKDSNDIKRNIPFEYIEQITNEMNIGKNIGLTKLFPKYNLILTLLDGQTRTYRMTENAFKESNDSTYRFRTENYADSIWKIAYKP